MRVCDHLLRHALSANGMKDGCARFITCCVGVRLVFAQHLVYKFRLVVDNAPEQCRTAFLSHVEIISIGK